MGKATRLNDSWLEALLTSQVALLWIGSSVAYCLERSWPLSTANLVQASRFSLSTYVPLLLEVFSGEKSEQRKAELFTYVLKEPEVLKRALKLTQGVTTLSFPYYLQSSQTRRTCLKRWTRLALQN